MKMTDMEFRQAVAHTALATGFAGHLIEKDYYCSLILRKLYESDFLRQHLIFKGGTLLAKAYLPFFRLSEDLDFAVSNSLCGDRKDRRKAADAIRELIPDIIAEFGLRELSPFRGFNESRQYNAIFAYDTIAAPQETIKFEVGFRGDLMFSPTMHPLSTLLIQPFTQEICLPPFEALVIAKEEAYAEKVRAALSRRRPAIRDFYDIAAISASGFDLLHDDFIQLVARKLIADDTAQMDLTPTKHSLLREKISTELLSVLKAGTVFSLEGSWSILETIARKVGVHGHSS